MQRKRARRDFLKSAGLAAGYWSTRSSRARADSPNEKLDVGVIAVGGRGANNLASVSSENIVALCDVNERNLNKAAEAHPKAEKYVDFRKVLDRKDIDAVVISTCDHTHAVIACAAMKAGKHVYCEKPMAHSVHEARAMAELAARSKVVTQMGNQHHSGGGYRRLVELVQSGAIGAVKEVHAWTDRPTWPQGIERPSGNWPVPKHFHWDLWLGPAPERPYHPSYTFFKWRGIWDFGTGALGDMGCHILDPAVWSLGLAAPTAVEAECPTPNEESPPVWSIVRWDFPARGELPPVRVTWYDGNKRPPKDVVGEVSLPTNGSFFVGEKGNILIEHGGGPRLLPEEKFAGFEGPKPFLPVSPGHHAEWIAACKSGGETGSRFALAGPFTETVLLGNVAIRVGKRIEWDPVAVRCPNAPQAAAYLKPEYRKGWSL